MVHIGLMKETARMDISSSPTFVEVTLVKKVFETLQLLCNLCGRVILPSQNSIN